ncbi:hypothetical protein H9P43_007749 [Blastocladiella emersonii ATCC 22665]|nr:hypothetical protein H9P43_007749 [Blastocladiella emersonii ATCC 22665]
MPDAVKSFKLLTLYELHCTLLRGSAPSDRSLEYAELALGWFNQAARQVCARLNDSTVIHTLKYHCLSEYVEFIKRFGPTTNLSTEARERAYQFNAKLVVKFTNHTATSTEQTFSRMASCVALQAIEYEGMDEVFNNLAEVRLSTLKATTFDLSKFGPGREVHFCFGTTAELSVTQLSTSIPFLAQILHGYLAEDSGLSAQRAADDPLLGPDDGKFLMSKAISFEAFSLGGFRNEQITGTCEFPTRGKSHADWVMYRTSDKKDRVGKLAAALHFTHNGTEHDMAIVEQFRVQNDAPGSTVTCKDFPVQALALHPAEPGIGLGRYHAVSVTDFQTFVHVVPNSDWPAAPTRAGAANALLNSEYREWLLNPFDCAGSAALMAYLWERDLLEVVV